MVISELKLILEGIQSVGVDEAIIEPFEDGSRIRAANKDGNIVIFDKIPETFSDVPMAIQSVGGLLSRINLFDENKASADLELGDECVTDILIKQGRKKATFRFAAPRNIYAPPKVPESDESDVVEFDKEYVQYLTKAIAAMSHTGNKENRTISFHGEESGFSVTISDGDVDAFDEIVDTINVETTRGCWEVVPFQRVMKQSTEHDGISRFTINNFGICTFDLGLFRVMVAPMAD